MRGRRNATVPEDVTTELLLIRHAPALTEGRMAGRRDVDADCSDALAFVALRQSIGAVDHLLISPARRCVQTAAGLWPDVTPVQNADLWEQNFGTWEGTAFAYLHDLGALSLQDVAAHRPPQGESFLDLSNRITPIFHRLSQHGGRVAVVAHAGVIRAALGLALGQAALGLSFQIAPLSLTTIIALPNRQYSIAAVNKGPK
jgi:alpha-ribazole phosphatase